MASTLRWWDWLHGWERKNLKFHSCALRWNPCKSMLMKRVKHIPCKTLRPVYRLWSQAAPMPKS